MTTEPLTIKSVGRFPPTIVTTTNDGCEDHWSFHHTIEPYPCGEVRCTAGRRDDLAVEADAAKGYTVDQVLWRQCEWVTESNWRKGQCGRSAVENPYGLALCWQHEDATFSHVLEQLRQRRYDAVQIEKLTHELLAAEGRLAGYDGDFGHVNTSPIVFAELKKYIETLLSSRYQIDPTVGEMIDRLIQKRLSEKWGASA